MKLKPNDPALITYKATVYYAKGNNAQALQLCEQAIKLNPNFARAYYQRGMILREARRSIDEALPDLQKAKSLGYGIDPDFIELMKRKAAAAEVAASPGLSCPRFLVGPGRRRGWRFGR